MPSSANNLFSSSDNISEPVFLLEDEVASSLGQLMSSTLMCTSVPNGLSSDGELLCPSPDQQPVGEYCSMLLTLNGEE